MWIASMMSILPALRWAWNWPEAQNKTMDIFAKFKKKWNQNVNSEEDSEESAEDPETEEMLKKTDELIQQFTGSE
jgi:hypothetical protein